MADINATDLTPETAATLDGSEEFVMFDNVEGKRGELDTVGDYIVQHCDADGNGNTAAQLAGGAQTDATAALGKIGDLASLTTTEKSTLVKAINEVDSHADTAQADATSAGTNASSALSKIGNLSSLDTTSKTDLVGAVNEVKGQADDNTTALQTKAEVDGAYEAMTVGNAEQLVSNIRVTDTDPYLFRTAGGSLEIGDREYPTLVGASVAKNQLIQNGNFASTSNWSALGGSIAVANNELTFTASGAGIQGVYQSTNAIKGHKYLYVADIKADSAVTNWNFSFGANELYRLPITTSWTHCVRLIEKLSDSINLNIIRNNDGVAGAVIHIKNAQLIDLTQWFGSTIADYIYTLEQGTAGAGVAFCKKYGIGVGYTAYNAGTLQSTTPTKHKTVGFNQFDLNSNTLENKDLDGGSYNQNVSTKEYIKALPDTMYCFSDTVESVAGRYVRFYDSNKTLINGISLYGASPKTFTTPSGTAYIRLMWYKTPSITVQEVESGNVCINLHWDGERDGEYEPYIKHEYDLGNDTLRGVFELNNGELKANGDVKTEDGTIQRKYATVDLGTLSYTYVDQLTYKFFWASVNGMKAVTSGTIHGISGKYPWVGVATTTDMESVPDKVIGTYNGVIRIKDTTYTDAAAFKTAMSGVYLIYELATPTEEEGTAFQSPQIVSNWGTEEYTEANGIVVGHSTEYPQDLKAKVESAPNNPSADGDYIVKRENGENAYVPLVIPQELPNAPSADGTYRLKCTVSGGAATYSWEA